MIQDIDPRSVKPFVKAMALTGRRYLERDKAQQNLDSHIATISGNGKRSMNAAQTAKLRKHIQELVEKEKRLAGYNKSEKERIRRLEQDVQELQMQLMEERRDKARMKARYQHTITDMKQSFAFLKGKLREFIQEKRERERKMDAIHQRISKNIKHDHYSSQSRDHDNAEQALSL